MTVKTLAALIVLNIALVAALLVTTMTPAPAQAQFAGGRSFLMIAGDVTGRSDQAAVYVIDQQSSTMISFLFNASNKKLEFVAAPRSIAQDARSQGGGGR